MSFTDLLTGTSKMHLYPLSILVISFTLNPFRLLDVKNSNHLNLRLLICLLSISSFSSFSLLLCNLVNLSVTPAASSPIVIAAAAPNIKPKSINISSPPKFF